MRIFKNLPYKLELSIVDLVGNFVSGLSVNYEIRKCIDDSIIYSGIMLEINSIYTKEIILTEVGEFRAKYITPEGYENGFETIIVDEYDNYKADVSNLALDSTVAKETTLNTKASQASIDAIKTETDKIKFILGLSQENYKLFDIVYSGDLITSTTIKTYPSAIDCENNTNPLAIYSVVATYDLDGKLLTYQVKKE